MFNGSSKAFFYKPEQSALAQHDPQALLEQYESLLQGCESTDEALRLQFLRIEVLLHLHEAQLAQQYILELISKDDVQNDLVYKSLSLLLLADSYQYLNQKHLALPSYESAYETAKESKDQAIIFKCLIRMANFHKNQSNSDKAIKLLNLADKTCNRSNLKEKIHVKMSLGSIYAEAENYPMATKLMTEALSYNAQSSDHEKQITILANLSGFYVATNRLNESVSILHKALAIAEEKHLIPQKGHVLSVLGLRNMALGDYLKALDQLKEALSIALSFGCDSHNVCRDISMLYYNIATCYSNLGRIEEAVQFLEKAEELVRGMDDQFMLHELSILAANNAQKLGQIKPAMEKLTAAMKFFKKQKCYDKLANVRYAMGLLQEAAGYKDKAIEHFKALPSIHKEHISHLMKVKTREYDEELEQIIRESDEAHRVMNRVLANYQKDLTQSFVGNSPAAKKALETALLASNHPNASVMITGESGTGKEVLASIIHHNSIRASYPFVSVNATAISGNLFESEFFGHKKGSFTGAVRDHVGYFMQANKGTLYLDEIGDMPLEFQIKLLTVLETRSVKPVGSSQSFPFDCRIICSTNANVEAAIEKGNFRLDLYHRLNTVRVHIIPLRMRKDDITVLLYHYLRHFAKEYNRSIPRLDAEFLSLIKAYNFPGNVRELKNIVERLFILNPGSYWNASALDWLASPVQKSSKAKEQKVLEQHEEQQRIIEALEQTNGVQKEAAKLLNMSASTLSRRISLHGLHAYTQT